MVLYKRGSRGAVVRQIQIALNQYPDSIFGPETQRAVKEFQMKHGLKPDGIVGPATLAKLFPQRLKKSKRTINEIIVHCSATPEGNNLTVEEIRRDHIQNRKFSDIGYHYVIYRDGSVHDGRNVDYPGAHCAYGGHNQHSIGICYIGGLENKVGVPYKKLKAKDTRTEEQKEALITLLTELKQMYPKAAIYGHHDFDKRKPCPSFDAKKEYENI